ncbi:hypothetical protein [Paenibacillus sp. FSL R10-2734]|uniref:hypothetical protein n=1 Tax=Paenibacillus sp. FSL R10-2734 TaxID=2954691 RepID=UPI0030D78014
MKKFKLTGFVSMALTLAMIITSGSALASPVNVPGTQDQNTSWTNTEDVIVAGSTIGTKEIITNYKKVSNEKGSSVVNLETEVHYILNANATDIQKDILKDKIDRTTIEVTDNGDYIVNGTQFSKEELNQELDMNNTAPNLGIPASPSLVTGGIPGVSHYYGDFTSVHFASYSDLNILGGPEGSNYQKNGSYNNTISQRAMSQIDIFYGDYTSLSTARNLFVIEAGIAIVTIGSVFSAITEGGLAVGTASQVWRYFQNCKSDLTQATNAINAL